MASLLDVNIADYVAPVIARSGGYIGRIGYFTNPGSSMGLSTSVTCLNGSGGGGYGYTIPGNRTNGTTALPSFSCPRPGTANFRAYLYQNGTAVFSISHNMTVEDCLTSTNLTKGCLSLTVPARITLLGNESDLVLPMPIEVNCGIENTTDYILYTTLRVPGKYCGTFITNHSCAPRNFNYTLTIPARTNCSAVVGSTGTIEMSLLTPADYEIATTPGHYYGVDMFAGYQGIYDFRVAGPLISVGITPGAPAVASIAGVSVVTPASLLPSGLSGSLVLEINPPNTSTSSGVIAVVDVQLANGSDFKVQNLSVPLEVTFPLMPPTPCKDSMCHYWDTTHNTWSTEGCNTLQSAAGEWICSCTHATDFSILLLDSPSCAAELTPTLEPFYAYSVLYIILGILALYPAIKVMGLRHGHYGIILEHLGVFAVCTLRTFLSMYQLGVSGHVTSVALSTISAVPRFLEFAIFSFIVATWGALLHFSMGGTNPFKRARPYFIGINVVALIIVAYVFIAFAVSPSYDAAIVGEALLATNSMFLSVGFLVYATWLHRQFAKAGGSSASSVAGANGCCNSRSRVVYIGWLLSFSFMAQAVFACLALSAVPRNGSFSVDPSEARFFIDLYNGLYRLFNLLTLGSILALYFDGIRKIVAKETGGSSSVNPSQQQHSQHSRVSTYAQSEL